MKAPKNFEKIHLDRFTSGFKREYKIGIEETYENNHIVWVFNEPDTTYYCLAVVFDWEKEEYVVKKARNGDGTLWADGNIHTGVISKRAMQTKESFIVWLSNIITAFEHEYND